MLAVVCPSCAAKLKAPDKTAGRTIRCPSCQNPMTVPAPVAAAPPPPPAAPFDLGEEDAEPTRPARHPRGSRAGHTTVIVNQPQGFPHVLHLVLCLLTCGAWLPVYALHALLASRGGGTVLAFLLGVPLALALLSCGGCVVLVGLGGAAVERAAQAQREALAEGDRLAQQGKPAEAVSKYKEGFAAAGGRKAELLAKIVDHEAKAKNLAEARRWIERGERENIAASYREPVATELLATARQEREAKRAPQKPVAEPWAGGGRKEQPGPKRGVSRANYDRVQEGMSLAEVEEILGPGRETASAGDVRVLTWEAGALAFRAISITFENDLVTGKVILD